MNIRSLLYSLTMVPAAVAAQQERPNIIFVLCDDMGWGDLACYGQQYISTPNIDRLASQGMQFMLFTYTIPHAELVQPEDSILLAYKAKFRDDKVFGGANGSWYHAIGNVHAQFAAMITRLDAYVGEIMDLLERKGMADNTILIFSSDNGPHEEGGADPTFFNRDGVLKGLKRSCHEGGIRIPFIVRWPGHVSAGQKNNHPIAFWDIMPTFCDIIGQQDYVAKYRNPRLGERDYFDGISFLPTLEGRDTEQRSHDYLYWEFDETDQIAVRQANWKLIVKRGVAELYDLATDVHEDHNVAADYPEKLEELKALVRQSHVDNPHFSVTLPK